MKPTGQLGIGQFMLGSIERADMDRVLRFLAISLTLTIVNAQEVSGTPPDERTVTCVSINKSASSTFAGDTLVTPVMITGLTLCAASTIIFISLLIYAAISEIELRLRQGSQPKLRRQTRDPPSVDMLGVPPSDRARNGDGSVTYEPTYAMITSDDVTPRYVETPARTRVSKVCDSVVVIEPRNLPSVPVASGSSSVHNPEVSVYSTISDDYANVDSDANIRMSNASSIIDRTGTTTSARYAVPRKQSVYESISEHECDIAAVGGSANAPTKSIVKRKNATDNDSVLSEPNELDEGYEMAQQVSDMVACDVTPKTGCLESDDGYQVAMKTISMRVSNGFETHKLVIPDSGYEVPRKENTNDEYYVQPDDVTKGSTAKGNTRSISDNSVYIFMGNPLPAK